MMKGVKEKEILGISEKIRVKGENKEVELIARIDSGADYCSIDENLAIKLGTGPIVDTKTIKNAHGKEIRPVVKLNIVLKGKEFEERFTLSDREGLSYKALVGQNLLKKGFLVDASLGKRKTNGEEK